MARWNGIQTKNGFWDIYENAAQTYETRYDSRQIELWFMQTRYISFELASLFISILVYLSFISTCIEFYWFSSPSWNQAVWMDLIAMMPASNVIFLLEEKNWYNKVCTVHTMFDVIFRCRLVEHQTYLIKKSDSIRLLCKHLETMTDQFS